jgi:hypothetical protein
VAGVNGLTLTATLVGQEPVKERIYISMDGINLTTEPGMIPEDTPELVWYSYVDINGQLHTKRYLSWGDYKEAGDSDFVGFYTRPYIANHRDAAVAEGLRLIRAQING